MNGAAIEKGQAGSPARKSVALAYGVMIAVGVALYLVIRWFGSGLAPGLPTPETVARGTGTHGSPLVQVLAALLAIIAASRLVGAVFRRLGQPPVIGEILAGILLGPSLLGKVAPGAFAQLFPSSVLPPLSIVAQIGVLLFMFVVGLELNIEILREKSQATLAISHASIVLPFTLGAGLALGLYPLLATRDVSFTAFSLFLGVSMSVTAFPVLARILTDRGLQKTTLGTMALTCAAVGDVTAWCLLALVVGVIQAKVNGAVLTAVLTVAYIAFMFIIVRPLARRFVAQYEKSESGGQAMMAAVTVALLLSSLTTELIGIHTLFGAFLLGAIIPHDSALARTLTSKLEDFVVVMLLPAFFAFTGLRTQIGLVAGADWLICGLIILVACAGKFGGTLIAGRLTGMTWRDASALGILMNTRGLMELIVLNIGLDMGVISPKLFAMLVIMAVVTTFATTPILDALTRRTALR